MNALFDQLALADVHQDVARNIVSLLHSQDLFDDLTSTIVRQVGDLRKMVDEFSSFARLPKPVFRDEDALDLVRQAVFLQSSAHTGKIRFETRLPAGPLTVACDSRQISQAGNWVDAPVQAATVQKLEDIILTRARDLRRSAMAN